MAEKPFDQFDSMVDHHADLVYDPLADFVDIIGDDDATAQHEAAVDDHEDLLADQDVFSKVVPMPGVGAELVDDPLDSAQVGTIESMLEELIAQLLEAKTVPLSSNVMVNKAAMIANLERVRSLLPDELRAARWMIREQSAFVARTNERTKETIERASQSARLMLDQAREEADEMVSQSNIVAEAVEEANILVRNAESESRRIRLQAEDYSEDRLLQLEHLFGNLVKQVRDTRSEYHQARPPAPEPPISR